MVRPLAVSAVLAAIAFSMPAWAAGEGPVIIAPGTVDGEPDVSTRDFKGHTAWKMSWYRDAQGRELQVIYVEDLEVPYSRRPAEMVKIMHDPSSDDEAALRQDVAGHSERIWGLDVFWLLASERAVMEPDPSKPETIEDGRLHRGDLRRTCAVFTANPIGRTGTLIGCYCRDLAPGAKIDEAGARQWLQALDLKLRP
jgi:hypothetical protein